MNDGGPFRVFRGGPNERISGQFIPATLLDEHGNPIQSRRPSVSQGDGADGAHFATLNTHLSWVIKALGGLWALCLLGAGWLFSNVYQPIQTLEKHQAVQNEVMSNIKGDLSRIELKMDNEKSINGPQVYKNSKLEK